MPPQWVWVRMRLVEKAFLSLCQKGEVLDSDEEESAFFGRGVSEVRVLVMRSLERMKKLSWLVAVLVLVVASMRWTV